MSSRAGTHDFECLQLRPGSPSKVSCSGGLGGTAAACGVRVDVETRFHCQALNPKRESVS